ncbi:MAG: protein kinase [Acidobacteriota bacterium]|jgi:serine/threonine-protein kinase
MDPKRWQQVEDLLAEALDQDPVKRDAFVAGRCGTDEELRAEVLSLLEASAEADDYFEELGGRAGIPRDKSFDDDAPPPRDSEPAPDDSLIGHRVSHFEIVGFLGQGGMGRVYRARDVQLNRDVALKVIADELAGNTTQSARLKREAQALAALNHPNIAAIYGVEKLGEHQALVLELVEGRSLSQVMKDDRRGGLRVSEALDIARQVADALEAAHDKGIVHRDLKPANIALTPDHQVKVLDFGIAKALQPDIDVDGDPEWSPTELMAATQPGRIMGTVSYMSPEQARGKPVDARTDVWAFGCVLYEMLAGKKAFGGETATDAIVSILEHEPDWEALPPSVPSQVVALLRRCLRKNPKRRLRSIGDAWLEIDEVLQLPTAERERPAVEPAAAPWTRALPWALAVVLGAAALWLALAPDGSPSDPTRRLEIAVRSDDLRSPLGGRTLAIAPDGAMVVHTSAAGLSLRPLDRFGATPIADTVGAESPFFSPDGAWVGYFARGRLWKVSVRGGAPFELCDASTPRGAYWDESDTIVYSDGTSLWRTDERGGRCEQLATPDAAAGEIRYEWPAPLPGGGALLFEMVGNGWSRLSILRLDDHAVSTLSEVGADAHYLATGHVVYSRAGSLFAVPFDIASLTATGDPRPVLDGVRAESTGAAHVAFARNGVVAYVPTADPDYRLVWVDRQGKVEVISETSGDYAAPRVAPDGNRIALAIRRAGEQQVWVHDVARDVQQRVTENGSSNWPDWTPDGERVLFSSGRRGPSSIWWKRADGTGDAEQLARTNGVQYAVAVADRAPVAAYFQVDAGGTRDIWALPLQPGAAPIPLVSTGDHEQGAALSPDGKWLAYVSNASGRNEVYVQPCIPCTEDPPETRAGRRQVSFNGGGEPVWASDGDELFFREGDRMMSVRFDVADDFRPQRPQVLFEGAFAPGQSGNRYYDIDPDGERFVMLQSAGPDPQRARINVIINWFPELEGDFSQ